MSSYDAAQESGAIQPAAAPASSQSGDASQLVALSQSSSAPQLAASDPNSHRPEQAEQQRICTMRDVHATPRQKWTLVEAAGNLSQPAAAIDGAPQPVAPLPLWFEQVIQRDLLCDAAGRRAEADFETNEDGPMPPCHVILEFMLRKLIVNLPGSFPEGKTPDVAPFQWYCSDAENPEFKIKQKTSDK